MLQSLDLSFLSWMGSGSKCDTGQGLKHTVCSLTHNSGNQAGSTQTGFTVRIPHTAIQGFRQAQGQEQAEVS